MIARGTVSGVRGGLVEVRIPPPSVGAGVAIQTQPPCFGTIRAIDRDRAFVAVHERTDRISVGTPVALDRAAESLPLGTCALGRAIDARAVPLDGEGALHGKRVALDRMAPQPGARAPIHTPMWTGVRAIDGLLTFGRGARLGLFGSPGVGKSTLLESIAAGVTCDAVVVGLIGERGREAQRWLERCDARTTVICATSDRAAAERVRAAWVTMAQARALCDRGLHVFVVLDSLARVAAALRELAVASGESTGRGGYPPSVFAGIAQLVEAAGATQRGSITLLATVLNDGDDRDPVSDGARSLLDGHIQLSPQLAQAGRFPAIDVLASASRTMPHVAGAVHLAHANALRSALALLERVADARALGLEPHDVRTRTAIAAEARIDAFLRQGQVGESPPATLAMLADLADTLGIHDGYLD